MPLGGRIAVLSIDCGGLYGEIVVLKLFFVLIFILLVLFVMLVFLPVWEKMFVFNAPLGMRPWSHLGYPQEVKVNN